MQKLTKQAASSVNQYKYLHMQIGLDIVRRSQAAVKQAFVSLGKAAKEIAFELTKKKQNTCL
jgi:hypothetical protein